MKFRCYDVVDPNPNGTKDPLNYCIVGDDRIFIEPTLAYCKEDVLREYPQAEFVENCGWVLIGEEDLLLDIETQMMIEENRNVPKTP